MQIVALHRRASRKAVSASALNANIVIIGMNSLFHFFIKPSLSEILSDGQTVILQIYTAKNQIVLPYYDEKDDEQFARRLFA